MKKYIAFIIIAVMLCFTASAFAMADSADCACLINAMTGEVIFSKNADTQHPMASTTKIMTAIVALENSDMDRVIAVSSNAAAQEGSSAYLRAGQRLKMLDALYGLMLNSGNDAAVAIAETVSGSEAAFAELMNKKAEEIGLTHTHFVNPNGLDADGHYTTAADLAALARYAMKNDVFRQIVSAKSCKAQLISGETLYFSNHNKLLRLYDGATGVKTGYTKTSGRCLVSSAKRDGMEFIAVTLGDGNDWNDHIEMLDYAFAEHYPKKIIEKDMPIKVAQIDGKRYNMIAADDFTVAFKENGGVSARITVHIADNLTAPINAGEKVGYAQVEVNGMAVGIVDVVSQSDILQAQNVKLKNSFYGKLIHIIKRLLI